MHCNRIFYGAGIYHPLNEIRKNDTLGAFIVYCVPRVIKSISQIKYLYKTVVKQLHTFGITTFVCNTFLKFRCGVIYHGNSSYRLYLYFSQFNIIWYLLSLDLAPALLKFHVKM